MFQTVLFPNDQSREAGEPPQKAIALAKSHQSHIIMLSVLQEERRGMNNAELVSSLLNRAKELIEDAGINIGVDEIKVGMAFAHGSYSKSLLDYCKVTGIRENAALRHFTRCQCLCKN